MFEYKFPMASCTSTLLMIAVASKLCDSLIVLGKRSPHSEAAPGMWCLPGGFLSAKYNKDRAKYPGESMGQVAVREAYEETRIVIDEADLQLYGEISTPDHDPRGEHVVSLWYWAEIEKSDLDSAIAGDDIVELQFIKPEEAMALKLAFNHNDVLEKGLRSYLIHMTATSLDIKDYYHAR